MDNSLASLLFNTLAVAAAALLVWRLAPRRGGQMVAARVNAAPARRRAAGGADRVPEDRC